MLLALALGALLRVPGLGEEPLWLDEATTAAFAARDLKGSALAEIQHPPLHTLLTHVAVHAGSPPPPEREPGVGADVARAATASNALARLPALLAGLLLILALAALARALARREDAGRAAALAAFLAAGSPFFVGLSQEARSFSLHALLAVLSTTLALRLLEPRAPARGDRLRLALYALSSALALLTHYLAALVLLAHELLHWTRWSAARRTGAPRPVSARAWLLARAAAAAACLPWALWVLGRLSSGAEGLQDRSWIGPPWMRVPYGVFRWALGYGPWPESATASAEPASRLLLEAAPWIALFVLPWAALALHGFRRGGLAPGGRRALALLVLLPFAVLLPLSPLTRLVHERYVCFVAAFLLVAVALGLLACRPRTRALLALLLALGSGVGWWAAGPRALRASPSPEPYGKEAWDQAAAFARGHEPTALLLAPGYVALAFDRAWLQAAAAPGARAVPVPERLAWPPGSAGAPAREVQALPRLRPGQRLAVVTRGLGAGRARLEALLAAAPGGLEVVASARFPAQAGVEVRVLVAQDPPR